MLFHEIYGSYYNVTAKVLSEACTGTLNSTRLYEIIREKGFGESALNIPSALSGEWALLTPDLRTPIKHPPSMPLTLLQKRWLRALLDDPRIRLFDVPCEGLEGIAPLYTQDVLYYFDRYHDGDPFESPEYIANFQSVLTAVKEKRLVQISFSGRHGAQNKRVFFPWHIEYSSKDDKFRLVATTARHTWMINLARVISVTLLGRPSETPPPPRVRSCTLIAELTDERNALERAMLHFSHLQKETVRLDKNRYRLTIRYDKDDETELLIRILAFGPMLRVTAPESFITLIRQRLAKQRYCGL